MKRIILSLGMLLMLAQNGFATTDAGYDKKIANASNVFVAQYWKCMKSVDNKNYLYNSDQECLKALEIGEKYNILPKTKGALFFEIAVFHSLKGDNYKKAYDYYMKVINLGQGPVKLAQRNLDILCREHSWVCK